MTARNTPSTANDLPETMLVAVTTSYMASGYDIDGDDPTLAGTSQSQIFHTVIQVYTPDGSAAANTSLLLMLEDPNGVFGGSVQITLNGQTVAIPTWSAGMANNATTDPSGRLVLEQSGTGTITSPQFTLYYVADADSGEACSCAISPDFGNFSTLNSLTGDDLGSDTAKDYAGNAVFSGYQDATTRDSIAQAVKLTISDIGTAGTPPSLVARPMRKGAAPGAARSANAVRAHSTANSSDFTLTIGAASASLDPSYNPSSIATDSLDGMFEDFVDDVVKGAEKLAKLAWSATDSLINAEIQGAEKVYQFVVTTMEQAAQVALAILKSVSNDIEQVYEWLSYVFDWEEIVANAGIISAQATTCLDNFQLSLANVIADVKQDIDTLCTGLKNDLDGALATGSDIRSALSTSVGQVSSAKQQQIGDTNACATAFASYHAQANWFAGQLKNSTSASTVMRVRDDSTDGFSALLDDLKQDFDAVVSALQGDTDQIQAAITSFFQSMKSLYEAAGDAQGIQLIDLLGLLQSAADIAILLLQTASDAVLTIIQKIYDLLLGTGQNPGILQITWNIPLVSAVVKKLMGGQGLSILNFTALAISCLVTPVSKTLGIAVGDSEARAAESDSPDWEKLVSIAQSVFTALVEGLAGIISMTDTDSDFAGPVNFAQGGLSAFNWAYTVGTDYKSFDPDSLDAKKVLHDAILAIPPVINLGNCLLTYVGKYDPSVATEVTAFEQQLKPVILTSYGFVVVLMAVSYAAVDPDDYFSPDGLPLLTTVIGELPDLVSALPWASAAVFDNEQTGEVILAVIGSACPLVVAFIDAAEFA